MSAGHPFPTDHFRAGHQLREPVLHAKFTWRDAVVAVALSCVAWTPMAAQPSQSRVRVSRELRLDANAEDFPPLDRIYVGTRGEIVVPLAVGRTARWRAWRGDRVLTVWVEFRPTSAGRRYLVLDSRGDSVGSLLVPASTRVRQASATHIWVTETDADGLSSAVRYRVSGLACITQNC